jgi:hypothetical protein
MRMNLVDAYFLILFSKLEQYPPAHPPRVAMVFYTERECLAEMEKRSPPEKADYRAVCLNGAHVDVRYVSFKEPKFR